jgi:aerobic carbon-monoxide dehydrogenase small subunit
MNYFFPKPQITPRLKHNFRAMMLWRRIKTKLRRSKFKTLSGRIRMSVVKMKLNGKAVSGDVEARTLLVDFIRSHQGMTGTHVGCDTSQCGACVVHVNGKAIKSCTTLAVACEGADVTTVEGLAKGGDLHAMQAAFKEHHGLQCGFCTPGMIMSAIDIVKRNGKNVSEEVIRRELSGNICRCTGYHNIVKAVQAGAANM